MAERQRGSGTSPKRRGSAFACKRCGGDLTNFLALEEERELTLATGVWVVPAGRFMRLKRDLTYGEFVSCVTREGSYRALDGDAVAFHRSDYLLHEDDVRRLSIAKGAVGGCCGLQPRAEANLVCPCGHLVATIHADECWSPLVVRLWADRANEVALS